ncbi:MULTISPECIES: hypothetical protein [Streptococcus]|uniref:Niacin transporter NiaX n=1 Tax=Streptococcus macedonicus TaxID=59310 RepID=A0AA47FDE0_STRMC|nr:MULTISPECIES: hypothetical protein [Streptococcus]CCF01899.1 Substrate-specific component NiaX of predicted niacin ECF transporter [Streptococcus macedonicus ACA-DC 198]ALT81252.1 hypothetical protein AU077_06850 [Streptococcus gallolyticus]MCW8485714.1 hypothetical protein [Streptococcus macedonicus]MCW8493937.1 hypothetical protein [Streptococcus macedonicus]MCW8499234.1 hypothetical protein [Streptococcus macedonicus]
MRRNQTKSLAFTAILLAFGILIPMVMPVKVVIGPASFTLASHVPVFMAMFISPQVAVLVALGTSLGFLFAGFPIVIVLRAVSHLLFAIVGAVLVQKRPSLLEKPLSTFFLALFLNFLHGLAEFIVVLVLTAGAHTGAAYVWSLVGLIGFGSLVHGCIDFYIAYYLWKFLRDKVGVNFSVASKED